MATVYSWAPNFNNTAGYTALDPQPASHTPNYTVWEIDGNSASKPEGFKTGTLRYLNTLLPSEFTDLLSQLGLDTAYSVEGTLALPIDARTFGDFNVILSYPRNLRYSYWYTSIEFPYVIKEEI